MDYSKLAKRHLEDALTKGYLTLDNEIKELKASEILAVAKYVVKEGWISDEDSLSLKQPSLPSEMFDNPLDENRMALGLDENTFKLKEYKSDNLIELDLEEAKNDI